MLGDNIGTAGWPGCGEIDIMENIGQRAGVNHGSMHGPGYSGGNALTAHAISCRRRSSADGFHVYAIEWEPNVVRLYVDDVLYETPHAGRRARRATNWVYDHPFFIILNVAVGGSLPGSPDGTTSSRRR